jgi:tyrosyl-tRNA synthetase
VKKSNMSDELLTRGVSEVIPADELQKKLDSGTPMKIYLGVDPTGPSIHIGHAVILRKMREFQKMGHNIVLLIGDFTARIGDPTDKDAARTVLTHEEVLANANSYQEQAAKILDFEGDNPAVLDYNSKWLDELKFQDVLELASDFTVQQMMERDMFEKRLNEGKPIHVHEFMYPIMQGYDSVAMDVDMEMGGNDQLFNMLAGRTLLSKRSGKEKVVMTFDLLEGTDGRKMSKSYHNIIGVTDEPADMFGKVMSLKDELIPRYFELATDVPMSRVTETAERLKTENPRDLKVELAREIVTMYHSADDAAAAEKAFFQVFADKGRPDDIPTYTPVATDTDMVMLLVNAELAKSKGEARRLMEQGGVRLNDVKMMDPAVPVEFSDGDVIQVGKRRFLQIQK